MEKIAAPSPGTLHRRLTSLLREQYGIDAAEAKRQVASFPKRHRLRADT